MPTFETPAPVTALVELPTGSVQVVASDRADTTVDVTPTDGEKRDDVLAAERTRLEYADGQLAVRTTRTWRRYSWSGDGGSVQVRINCPTGSALTVEGAMVSVRGSGRYDAVQVTTSLGTVTLDDAQAVEVRVAGLGDVTVRSVEQDAQISTGSGAVRLGRAGGRVEVRNSNGDTWIGESGGPAQIKAANGGIVVGSAAGDATGKTANGDVRFGRVERGEVVAESGCGRVEVGVAAGVAAWLDLQTGFGRVRNDLADRTPPAPDQPVVRVRARSGAGDLAITRANDSSDAEEVRA